MSALTQYLPITDPTWIFFIVLGIILFAPMLLERLRIPSIVGLITAGICIGPYGFHILERDSSFELFGKVGLYYIMFLAALEMNVQDVKKAKGGVLTFGLLSFAIPMALGTAVNSFLPGTSLPAAVLMAAMYASHTLIAYPIVMRYGLAQRGSVNLAVGGTIVADTLTLLVLAVVGGMFKEHVGGYAWLTLLAKVVILSVVIIVTFPRMARAFFRRYDDGVVQYIFVLAMVFLGAGLMEIVGMEGILGAFLAGIVLNSAIPPASPLMNHLEFVGNALFIPYFLIGVGMLLNVHSFTQHPYILVLALVMVAVGSSSKWLAAALTQRIYKLSRRDGNLLFGLSNSRAAATLAVVLVGHSIVLDDGSTLLSDDVMNAAMIFILITCLVSSFVTQNAARGIAESRQSEGDTSTRTTDRIIIALSNPGTVTPLVHAALMLRTPHSPIPLTALNVVLEDNPEAREEGLRQLNNAVKIAAEANVKLITRSRWSVNVVSGIAHTMKEFEASDLLIGLHQKARLTEPFFGKLSQDLVTAVDRQISIYREATPLSTLRCLHVLIPRKAEFEPGFYRWATRLALLTRQISCRLELYSGRGTLEAVTTFWEKEKYHIACAQHIYTEWHDLLTLARATTNDHMVVFVMARRGTLSYHNYMAQLPDQIERYFSSRSLLIFYPPQVAIEAETKAMRTGMPIKVR